MNEFGQIASSLPLVRQAGSGGLLRWQCKGRLIARQLDGNQVVIRTPFDTRDVLLHQFPDTFSLPRRFEKHMMVAADLANGDAGAIEDAVTSAWRLQMEAD
jgi:hypothetical protein